MVTLLYHHDSNGAICRRIAAANPNVRVLRDTRLPATVAGTLVRWDSTAPCRADRTINTAEAVALSRNKRDSRWLLGDLTLPTWISTKQCAFPCVVRPKRHFGGLNFHLCRTKADLERAIAACKSWYASPFIQRDAEYRVFVLHGEAYKITRHYREDGASEVPWNHHNGGSAARIRRENWPAGVATRAVEAAARLGLDFCAVDIMALGRRLYVLECNTAPGLERPSTIAKLAERFVAYDRRFTS